MADLALRLPIFIASPSDAREERRVVQGVVDELATIAATRRLLLEPLLWEYSAVPGVGRPQYKIDRSLLKRAELVVALFAHGRGSAASTTGTETGTEEEIRSAEALVEEGIADDLFVYFRRSSATGESHDIRRRMDLEKRILFWDYMNVPDLEATFRRHLTLWLERWSRITDICEYTLRRIPAFIKGEVRPTAESELHLVESLVKGLSPDDARALGVAAVRAYQLRKPVLEVPMDLAHRALTGAPRCIVPHPRGVTFGNGPWDAYFAALGLRESIINKQHADIEGREYTNDIHQFLAALIAHRTTTRERQAMVGTLVDWLCDRAAGKPVVRNFSAYVLGMTRAREAHDQLADAAENDDGLHVRVYATIALGKLRARAHIPLLVKLFDNATDDEKLLIGQAICRMIGVARYEL